MSKRRASVRGRGAEILFGEPPPPDVEPRAPGEPGEADAPTPEPPAVPPASLSPPDEASFPGDVSSPDDLSSLDEDALEHSLYEEARDGLPDLEGEEVRPLPWEVVDAPTPEMETAFVREAFAAEVPPEPVAEVPTPTLEETMEERDRAKEMAMHEPPPSEVEDVSMGVLPPKPDRSFIDMHTEPSVALDIQQPDQEAKPFELPNRELTEEQKQAVLAWWGDRRVRDLSKAIDSTYVEARRKVGENAAVTTEIFNLLLKARDILTRREAARMAQAEYYIEMAQARLKRVIDSESVAKKVQWPLLGWGLLWGIAFLVLLIFLGQPWFQNLIRSANEAQTLLEMNIFVPAMLWGGIGGAVAVLYSLFKHIGQRDFDSQYIISYVGKPFMGLIVGGTVYMVLNLVIRALGILPAGLPSSDVTTPTIAPGIVYLTAWAAGFKENRLLELVDRTMKQIFGAKDEEQEEPAPATGATPPTQPVA